MVARVRGAWGCWNAALGVFIDLKKAFDTVDHRLLLTKLGHYGVRGAALGLLEGYLGGRAQYVVHRGHESARRKVECCVPQGSVMGPLFFILYINDMVRACEGRDLVLFADDTNIFAEGSNPTELFGRVNRGLDELSRWFRCNRLTLNLRKTEYVYFAGPGGHGVPQGGIKIGGKEIRRDEGACFQGV